MDHICQCANHRDRRARHQQIWAVKPATSATPNLLPFKYTQFPLGRQVAHQKVKQNQCFLAANCATTLLLQAKIPAPHKKQIGLCMW